MLKFLRKIKLEYIVGSVSVLVTVGVAVVIIREWSWIRSLSAYGYLGAFVISVFSGGTVIVPIPGLAVIFSLGGVLNPIWVGIVAGLGEAIGALTIYLTGMGGRTMVQTRFPRFYPRMVGWLRRRGDVTVFLYSAVINPFFYPLTLACGALRFGLWRFFFLSFAGKTVKSLVIAYIGYFSLHRVFHIG
jgi:membrane protein YqaA with SNARE-associated domain